MVVAVNRVRSSRLAWFGSLLARVIFPVRKPPARGLLGGLVRWLGRVGKSRVGAGNYLYA